MKKQQIMKEIFGSMSDEEMANSSDHEVQNKVGGLVPAHEGKTKCEGEGEGSKSINALKGSSRCRANRSAGNEKGKDKAEALAALLHDVFGDSDDDEAVESVVRRQSNEKKQSPMEKAGDHAEESRSTKVKSDEEETYEFEKERKGKGVAPHVEVFQIPLRAPPAPPNKMATIKLSNLIGIDPKPFDPMTFEEDDIYVTDEFGAKRLVPSSNIIRFREVKKADGTISVESNARFVEWSDGSLQLLIGNEAFDVSKQDAREIQSHLFLKHGKEIYQCQGKIPRKMNFMPSSLSSNSHRSLAALVESRHKKVNKVRRYISDEDPESTMKLNQKAETEINKASKQLNVKKKKVINKYKSKGRKEHELTPGFLEESDDEDDKQDLEMKAATGSQHKMNAKMSPKYTRGISSVKSPMEALNISKEEKVEMSDQFKGKKVEGSISFKKVMKDEEELHDGSVGPKGQRKVSGSKLKKKVIESDDEMPPPRTATRRRNAIMYDSSDE